MEKIFIQADGDTIELRGLKIVNRIVNIYIPDKFLGVWVNHSIRPKGVLTANQESEIDKTIIEYEMDNSWIDKTMRKAVGKVRRSPDDLLGFR